MAVLDHKCPSCNANLPFNPTTGKWNCAYCGASYELEELTKIESKSDVTEERLEVYTCLDCGAQIVANENTSATFCVYCGNTSIIKDRLVEKFEPDKIIPFKLSKEEAIKRYKGTINKKLLVPNKFKSKSVIEKITGIYVPFWLFDCDGDAKLIAKGENVTKKRKGDYLYTTKKEYQIVRESNFAFEGVPADGLVKIDNVLMDSIEPYDYNSLKEFNMSYLAGFFAEKYDVNKNVAYGYAKKRINNTIDSKMKNVLKNVNGYDNVEILKTDKTIYIRKAEYDLLPVWLLSVKYENNNYLCAVNGQTGKCAGDFLISKFKVIWLYLAIFLNFNIIYFAMLNWFSINFVNLTTEIIPISLIILFLAPYIILAVSICKLRSLKKQMQKKENVLKSSYDMSIMCDKLEKLKDLLYKIISIKWIGIFIALMIYMVVMIGIGEL